jgi:hypothetical protein
MMVVRLVSRERPAGTGTSANSLRGSLEPEEAHDVRSSVSVSVQRTRTRAMEATSRVVVVGE